MNVEINGETVAVTLSERNLRALLDKLTWEESERTIFRDCENGMRLVVVAEPNEVHYANRPPGQMHPRTGAAIAGSA